MKKIITFIIFIIPVVIIYFVYVNINSLPESSNISTIITTFVLYYGAILILIYLPPYGQNENKTYIAVLGGCFIIIYCTMYGNLQEVNSPDIILLIIVFTVLLVPLLLMLSFKDKDTSFNNDLKHFTIDKYNISFDKEKKAKWIKLEKIFIDDHKKESLSLMKKYKLMEVYEYHANNESIKNIFKIKHIIDVLNVFQESLLDIFSNKDSNTNKANSCNNFCKTQSKELLSEAIYASKYNYYKMVLNLLESIFTNLSIFLSFLIFLTLLVSLLWDIPTEIIKINDILKLNMGLYLFSLSFLVGYFIYFLLKINSLKKHPDSKHNNWNVVLKNLSYFFVSFSIFTAMAMYSLSILRESGLEFQQLFHFVINLILPTLSINDVITFMSLMNTESDIVPMIIFFKLIIIIASFIVITIILKHFMEKYIELYEKIEKSTYAIPPEFLKFFGYMILFILTVVLLYGTIFINYPNLEKEYATCKTYVSKNNKTLSNCTKENLSGDEKKYCKYIRALEPSLKLEFDKCEIGILLNDTSNNSSVNSVLSEKDKTSLSDYIPLSMFLTFFGAMMMISSKNLVENYFHGVSLKINPPYEEGERVTIDNGEMLSVEDIGFRATTFYGISTNTHLVIPHQKLTQSIIKNYTQPTLNYREKISINIPDSRDNQSGMNNPRDAEHMLLLAAYISTGVKIPKINIKKLEEPERFKECVNKYITEKTNTNIKISESIEILEKTDKGKNGAINDIYDYVKDKPDIQKTLFISDVYKISNQSDKNNEFEVVKKIIASIVSAVIKYQEEIDKLNIEIDSFNVRRKENIFEGKEYKDLNKISELLVSINYYYFYLAKQLWILKDKDRSDQQKKIFDNASLELLDVPRVTSVHKRDELGSYWEVTLLVTVELAEQSDEIIQHINMFVDKLMVIYQRKSRKFSNILLP